MWILIRNEVRKLITGTVYCLLLCQQACCSIFELVNFIELVTFLLVIDNRFWQPLTYCVGIKPYFPENKMNRSVFSYSSKSVVYFARPKDNSCDRLLFSNRLYYCSCIFMVMTVMSNRILILSFFICPGIPPYRYSVYLLTIQWDLSLV